MQGGQAESEKRRPIKGPRGAQEKSGSYRTDEGPYLRERVLSKAGIEDGIRDLVTN